MDVNELIESGILEAYVLGTASEAERQLVEDMAFKNPSVKAELDAIESMFEQLGRSQAIAPPSQLQSKIWDKLSKQDSLPTGKVTGSAGTAVLKMQPGGPAKGIRLYRMAAVFIGILCLASLALNLYMGYKIRDMKDEMAILTRTQANLSQIVTLNTIKKDSLSKVNGQLVHQLSMADNPDMMMVHLMGTPSKPGNHVMLYWDTKTKDVYVHIDKLPAPAHGMQYQLWAIIGGKPVDAGVITAGDMLKMKTIDGKVQAFAVTLEKAGGGLVPSLDQMYVMGKV